MAVCRLEELPVLFPNEVMDYYAATLLDSLKPLVRQYGMAHEEWPEEGVGPCDCGGATAKTTHSLWCKTTEGQ